MVVASSSSLAFSLWLLSLSLRSGWESSSSRVGVPSKMSISSSLLLLLLSSLSLWLWWSQPSWFAAASMTSPSSSSCSEAFLSCHHLGGTLSSVWQMVWRLERTVSKDGFVLRKDPWRDPVMAKGRLHPGTFDYNFVFVVDTDESYCRIICGLWKVHYYVDGKGKRGWPSRWSKEEGNGNITWARDLERGL